MSQEIKIRLRHLNKSFGDSAVLHDINIDIKREESMAIIGGSGSGKSVLLKCIAGLILPDLGSSIVINNQEVAQIHILKRHNFTKKFAMLFQGNALFDSLTARENIVFGLKNGSSRDLESRANEVLDKVELSTKILDCYPSELSGGQQKRVALARAIIRNPEVIFLDEPTSGLDPITSQKISRLIAAIQQESRMTVIVISHDPACVQIIAQKCMYLANGTISWQGKVEDLHSVQIDYLQAFIGKISMHGSRK